MYAKINLFAKKAKWAQVHQDLCLCLLGLDISELINVDI